LRQGLEGHDGDGLARAGQLPATVYQGQVAPVYAVEVTDRDSRPGRRVHAPCPLRPGERHTIRPVPDYPHLSVDRCKKR
jgi:hypothetical protein